MTSQEAVRLAITGKTIIPAFNIPYLPMVQPIIDAVTDENSIAMIQVARLEWEKFSSKSLEAVAEEYFKYRKTGHTLLHLDHVPVIDEDNKKVDVLPIIKRAIKAGYQSVMVDGSRLDLDANIKATRAVAELAHGFNIGVEAELGAVVGHEAGGLGISYEELFLTKKGFTDVDEARRFAYESGCDWLSVAAGSIHGAIAIDARKEKKPNARLDIEHIKALQKATKGMPLVLHGGSGIKQEYILAAIENGVGKINVATEIRQPYEKAREEYPNDIEYAKKQVYDKTRWIIKEFLKTSQNKTKLFD